MDNNSMERVYEARRRNLAALIERENDEHGRGGLLVVAKRADAGYADIVVRLLG